ncbi:DUF7093 family protein [Halobellus sp. EA9]|uniref:DUF7093 family protein n=1 Tax=Halobellus sp. EA9 TaxID=3421647 RepID=UPI003EBA6D1A
MGLKCRLLGHTYGEPEVERNREEQGDEVVVTIREIQACERCGDEQVVSQNKEVTAIRSPEEVGLDGDAGSESGDAAAADAAPQDAADGEAAEQPTVTPAESTADPVADEGATADATPEASEAESTAADAASASASAADDGGVIDEAEAGTGGASDGWETGSDDWEDVEPDGDADDAVILDDAETERDETQWPGETDTDPQRAARESAAREEGAAGAEPDADDEVTNDAEIIDADDGQSGAGASADADTGRERGEWAGREAGSASNGWPDHEGEDEGYAATPGGDADVEFDSGGGLTPEVNGHADADDDAETIEGIAAGADDARAAAERNAGVRPEAASEGEEGFARAGESTTLESDVPDDRVEFYCPNCGHSRVAGASSMRAGDICPECKQGYIAERER